MEPQRGAPPARPVAGSPDSRDRLLELAPFRELLACTLALLPPSSTGVSLTGAKLQLPLAVRTRLRRLPALTQLALTVLFSTHPLSELLKFHELGDQRFETLSKKSRRILRSYAGIHDTSPDRGFRQNSPTPESRKTSAIPGQAREACCVRKSCGAPSRGSSPARPRV